MVDHITDTKTITVNVASHANCEILNIVCPTQVESGVPFTVTYNCHNIGSTDTCYGQVLLDTTLVVGSRWDASITAGATRSCSVTILGITSAKNVVIQSGYTTV